MNEKAYKAMGLAGAAGIAVGIVVTVVGIAAGVISIISGARLLKEKKGILILYRRDTGGCRTFDSKKRKRIRILGKILIILYVIFIIYFLLFSDWYGRTGEMREYHYNLVLFKEIKRFWQYREQVGFFAMFTNLFGNVIIFIPFGFFLPMGSRQRSFIATAYYSFVLSLCVEVFQLITKVGSFDVDDLLLNTIGGICGYILFAICAAIRRRHAGKKTKNRR